MTKAEAISRLRACEPDLRKLGIERLGLFGSTAREEAGPGSDVDLVGAFARDASVGLFKYAAIMSRLEEIVGSRVDFVTEPVSRPRLRANIERDRTHVF